MDEWYKRDHFILAKDFDALVKSKSLEKVIDNEIDRVTKILTQKELKK